MSIAPVYSALNAANLWNEIQNGPYKTVLATHVTNGDDQGIANILNDPAGTSAGVVNHAPMQPGDVGKKIIWTEFYATLTADQRGTWDSMMNTGSVAIGEDGTQGFFDLVFTLAGCPNTRTAIQALYTQQGSRSEVAFGTGTSVTAQQVNIARTTSGAGSF